MFLSIFPLVSQNKLDLKFFELSCYSSKTSHIKIAKFGWKINLN